MPPYAVVLGHYFDDQAVDFFIWKDQHSEPERRRK
jgi:hypothetical protein